MKVVHVIPHIDQEASGPSYSVPTLCKNIASRGLEVELSCLAAKREITGVTLDIHPQWSMLKRFAVSPSHAYALSYKAEESDVIHNHSLWSMVNLAAGLVVPGKRAKLVTSPRGTLSDWAMSRSKRVKRILWPLQRRVLSRADMLHATSEVEYNEIRALGFTAPVAVIPNGIDLPKLPKGAPSSEKRTLLFLSRIHPTKCVDRLLLAWKALQAKHQDWRLVIAGKGEQAYLHEIESLAVDLELERLEFTGPLYGEKKSNAYREAELFVLPTHSENFGMVVAEALAHGCPTVVSKGAPWSGLEEEGCGWWVDHDVESLTASLEKAMSLSTAQLASMGLQGRDWMQREFSWDSVAHRMTVAYRWLLEGGEKPEWVKV